MAAVATKEQERKALEEIKKIIAELGENSYIGSAFDGAYEIAERNIEWDAAFSVKGEIEVFQKELEKKVKEVSKLKEELDEAQRKARRLEEELDRELEWQPHEMPENVKQSEYEALAETLCEKCGTFEMTDEAAKHLLNKWFGFEENRIEIKRSVPAYEKDRHGKLKTIGEIERKPLYNATDWNYIRFDCGQMTYELHNGHLNFFVW